MLNIITSLSIYDLANDMLDKIQKCWTSPFDAPVIIFPDAKTEQWFKLYILDKQNVVMNLRTERLELFLFNALRTDKNQRLLSQDLLRDVIIQKLLSTENGTRYVDAIRDKDNIEHYLYRSENAAEINYNHLFYFADDLSKLFIEYETSRENIDDAISGDDWQKDLYNNIMRDGILINSNNYYTCPALANKNRNSNNGQIVIQPLSNNNVFVFGFSGMGQTYRNLLKTLGNQINVNVYLQTTVNNQNIFLKHWAQFGNINCALFKHTPIAINTSTSYCNDTTLGKIQTDITNDICVCKKHHADTSLTITSAPSKIKELELVHSSICKLLKNESVMLKDILVLAPDIGEYTTAISTVFNQVDKTDAEYPIIPVSIVDYIGANSSVSNLLQTLYSILHNGGLTRKTFFGFVTNSLIQSKYNINDDDVFNVFQNWIEKTLTYRVHKLQDTIIDDWKNTIDRLLTAKLTNKQYDGIKPFSDINTTDDNLVTKFVQILDDIQTRWIQKLAHKVVLSPTDIADLQTGLNDLIVTDDGANAKASKETIIWNHVNQKLELFKEFNIQIPLECLLLSMIDVATNIKFNTGMVFTHGVTFTSLISNRILPAKYVFLIGMDSEHFPGINKNISLDRRILSLKNGDDSIPDKNKNAFLCQLMATTDELHISFVDKDLQTGNVYYPSYVLDVLGQYTDIKTKHVGIDETRPWKELYTPRGRMNKQTYIILTDHRNENDTRIATSHLNNSQKELPDTVKLKDMLYFLENPLKYYMTRVFGFDDTDTSNEELEDINLDNLKKSRLQKRLVKPLLNNDDVHYDDYTDLLPAKHFGAHELKKVTTDLRTCIDLFKEEYGNIAIKSNYPINLQLKYGNKQYVLTGEILMCAQTDNDVYVFIPKINESKAKKYYPEIYALFASQEQDKAYNAHIVWIKKDKKGICSDSEHAIITPHDAVTKLNEFYKRMFITTENRYIPYFNINPTKVDFETLKEKFVNEMYLPHAKLLNPDVDLGFTAHGFDDDFAAAYDAHSTLLPHKFDSKE